MGKVAFFLKNIYGAHMIRGWQVCHNQLANVGKQISPSGSVV